MRLKTKKNSKLTYLLYFNIHSSIYRSTYIYRLFFFDIRWDFHFPPRWTVTKTKPANESSVSSLMVFQYQTVCFLSQHSIHLTDSLVLWAQKNYYFLSAQKLSFETKKKLGLILRNFYIKLINHLYVVVTDMMTMLNFKYFPSISSFFIYNKNPFPQKNFVLFFCVNIFIVVEQKKSAKKSRPYHHDRWLNTDEFSRWNSFKWVMSERNERKNNIFLYRNQYRRRICGTWKVRTEDILYILYTTFTCSRVTLREHFITVLILLWEWSYSIQ